MTIDLSELARRQSTQVLDDVPAGPLHSDSLLGPCLQRRGWLRTGGLIRRLVHGADVISSTERIR